jgi:predicted DNA-binding transcriptional regulator AlpA
MMRTQADKLQDHLGYPPRGMDAERAATYLGLGRTKFLEMVDEGRMPKPVRIEDELPRWDRYDLDAAWEDLKQQRHDPIARGREELDRRLRRQQGK